MAELILDSFTNRDTFTLGLVRQRFDSQERARTVESMGWCPCPTEHMLDSAIVRMASEAIESAIDTTRGHNHIRVYRRRSSALFRVALSHRNDTSLSSRALVVPAIAIRYRSSVSAFVSL
jgi:hypothetical protein